MCSNGHDCGLYMLKYVERLANSLPDLACGVKRKRGVCDAVRWSDHSELSFKDAAIDYYRFTMAEEIEALSKEQKAESGAKRAKKEPAA